jgi:hypothetical protein
MSGKGEQSAADDRDSLSASGQLEGGDRDPAGADREPVAAARLATLERHARWLLRAYPAAYRRERGEEIIGTLLEASASRTWPLVRDVRALAVGGLKARAVQNRQRTVGANLRVAAMAGLAMYISLGIAQYVDSLVQGLMPGWHRVPGWTGWPPVVIALLTGATIVLAWTAPRVIVIAAALAATAAVAIFGVANSELLGTPLLQALALAGLAALASRAGHPSLRWLLLPGLIALSWVPLQLGVGYSWLGDALGLFIPPGLPLLSLVVGGVLWIGIDARLIVAVLTYFAVIGLQAPVSEIPSGFAVLASLPYVLVVIALAAPAIWLLRRQSARPIRAS